jgi:rifampicin phosphotransferase
VLRKVLEHAVPDRAELLGRELLTGLLEVESAAPGVALWHIAETARSEPEAYERLIERGSTPLRIDALPHGPTRRSLQSFLEAYGHRGPREAELMSPRWCEEPALLFAALRLHLTATDGSNPAERERQQRQRREAAVAEVHEALRLPSWFAVRRLLELTQRFTRLRERLRGHVTEILGMLRRVALDASTRIERRERDVGSGSAFFLTLDELHAVLRNGLRVGSRVRRRRHHYEQERNLPDPPHTFVGFPPPVPGEVTDAHTLTGLPASSGIVEGTARVLRSSDDAGTLVRGEIIVAPSVDVGWSPLFLAAAAVVTDVGGPLSHAAVVLREYGVPAVFNVQAASRRIQTGDRLRVDGDQGTVQVLTSGMDDGQQERVDANV